MKKIERNLIFGEAVIFENFTIHARVSRVSVHTYPLKSENLVAKRNNSILGKAVFVVVENFTFHTRVSRVTVTTPSNPRI